MLIKFKRVEEWGENSNPISFTDVYLDVTKVVAVSADSGDSYCVVKLLGGSDWCIQSSLEEIAKTINDNLNTLQVKNLKLRGA